MISNTPMKYLLIMFLAACNPDNRNGKIAPGNDSAATVIQIRSLGMYYCCDTIRTLNHTAIVKRVLDTNGVLVRFEIVKVLK